MHERRSAERQDLIYFPPVFDTTNEGLLGHMANVSPEGLRLISQRPIEPNMLFDLVMYLPAEVPGSQRLEFEASSRWSRQDGDSGLHVSGFELNAAAEEGFDLLVHTTSNPVRRNRHWYTAKRLFDVLASALGLAVLSPMFLLIGFVTKFSSHGPVFYMARRIGRFGRPFNMHKFRTMTGEFTGSGPRVTAHDDPRITRIGRLLRQTKLNELPQLVNVLMGNMSLVGPRPEDAEFVAHYTPEQREVLTVLPGITSLATIMFAGEEKMLSFSDAAKEYLTSILPDKLQLDLLYVRNRSMLLDLDILVHTALVLIPRFSRAAPQVEDIVMGPLRMARRHLSWFVVDTAIALISISIAGALWLSATPQEFGSGRSLLAALLIAGLFSVMNWLTGIQQIQWRYASPGEATGIIGSAALATAVVLIANSFFQPAGYPVQVLIVAGIFSLSGFLVARYWRRLLHGWPGGIEKLPSATTSQTERVLIVGAGDAGQLTAWLLQTSPAGRAFDVVGLVDDDFDLLGTLVHRVPVLGLCARIPDVVREKEVTTIVFAINGIDESRRQHLLRRCRETNARTVMAPDLLKTLARTVSSESGDLITPKQTALSNQVSASNESGNGDLRHRIAVLAEQARSGDTASVVSGLSKLNRELEEADASD